MDLRALSLGAFSVVGQLGQGPVRFSSAWIRPLWSNYEASKAEVQHLAKRGAAGLIEGCWGVLSDARAYLAPWDDEGRYLAGVAANPGASPPPQWTLWTVPARTYLVATCTKASYKKVHDELMRDLANSQKYRLDGAMMEFYPTQAGGRMDIYLPIGARDEG